MCWISGVADPSIVLSIAIAPFFVLILALSSPVLWELHLRLKHVTGWVDRGVRNEQAVALSTPS